MVKLRNDNRICFCGSRSRIHSQKSGWTARFQCDGKRRSEFRSAVRLYARPIWRSERSRKLTHLAEPGENGWDEWPIDGGPCRGKFTYQNTLQRSLTLQLRIILNVELVFKFYSPQLKLACGKCVGKFPVHQCWFSFAVFKSLSIAFRSGKLISMSDEQFGLLPF